jgi:release factor glutamine methyltransferase
MSETWTVRKVLSFCTEDFRSRGIESARLDGELLIASVLGIDRVKLYMDLDRPLTKDELTAIRERITRRRRHEPVAYLLGRREFWSRDFAVDSRVLIPRPDTETLIERALQLLPAQGAAAVADVGTGSGCIAVTLAAERPEVTVHALDVSLDALEVARANAERHGVASRISFQASDVLSSLSPDVPLDAIVSNPPYIAEHERATLSADVLFEPDGALFSGPEGLDVLTRLASQAASRLGPGGWILVEIGADQGPAVKALFEAAGLHDVQVHKDLGGRDRVVEGHR